MKTKKDLIAFIKKLVFLPAEKRDLFLRILEGAELGQEKLEEVFQIFRKAEDDFLAIQKERERKIDEINKKYLKEIENYFRSKKKEILKKRNLESKNKDEQELSALLDELEDV